MKLWFNSLHDKLIKASLSALGVRKLVMLDNMSKGSVLTWNKGLRFGHDLWLCTIFLRNWSEQKPDDRQSKLVSNFIGKCLVETGGKKYFS